MAARSEYYNWMLIISSTTEIEVLPRAKLTIGFLPQHDAKLQQLHEEIIKSEYAQHAMICCSL